MMIIFPKRQLSRNLPQDCSKPKSMVPRKGKSEDEGLEKSTKRKKNNPEEGNTEHFEEEDSIRVVTSSTPSRNLLDMFRSNTVRESPGTPTVDTDTEADTASSDDDDDRINKEIDLVKEGNVKKAHGGLITTIDIFHVARCESNGFYRASISDGTDLSNKVLFNAKLNKQVEEELIGDGKVSIVRIDTSDILEKTIIGVMAFTKLGEGPQHVGEAQFLGDAFYRGLKPRGCMTPSRMKKNRLFK